MVAIYTLISFVSDIDQTGQGEFGIAQLLYYTLMMVPTGIYILMPVIALLGTLMGLGTLAAQHEVTGGDRSEERRVGLECVSPCRSWWVTFHYKKNDSISEVHKTLKISKNKLPTHT